MATLTVWARRNLFSGPLNVLISVVLIPLTVYILYGSLHWMFLSARWAVITDNLSVLMIGTFPQEAAWRAWSAAGLLAAQVGITVGLVLPGVNCRNYFTTAVLSGATAIVAAVQGNSGVASALACLAILAGACALVRRWPLVGKGLGFTWVLGLGAICAVLAPVGTNQWGGLLLSVLVTAIATLLSLPLGILLAFGRQSKFASIRLFCTGYIELVRSIPLICVVYWAWIIVPLIFPPKYHVPDLVRGVIGFALFFAAYAAEYVRAGIQGVPKGQEEAAQSLGLSKADESFIIVLPQALKSVLPALVGNVLDLFNNVPALFIIGLTDFLKAGQTILADPRYSGSQYEVYAFLFTVYFIVGSLISYATRRLETKMAKGH